MNVPPENERLLSDILAEGPAAAAREALLNETLLLAGRRRRFRQTRRVASALAVLVAGLFLTHRHSPTTRSVQPEPSSAYILVRSQPQSESALVVTKPISVGSLISSSPTTSVVTTATAAPQLREINDDDLLALASPNPAVLVRHGPGSAVLIFVHPSTTTHDPDTAEP